MADTQQLIAQAKCYECYGLSLDEGIELALLQTIVQTGLVPSGSAVQTEAGEDILTEAGDTLITE